MGVTTLGAVPQQGRTHATSYQHAHLYFMAALLVIVAGFWPSFFGRPSEVDRWHSVHGISATLWIAALITQSWLMSRGLVRWHRRVALAALLLLPVLVASALYMVRLVLTNRHVPPFPPAMLAFIDLPSVVFLVVLVILALSNLRTPAAHKRFMSATALLALPRHSHGCTRACCFLASDQPTHSRRAFSPSSWSSWRFSPPIGGPMSAG